MYFIVWRDPNDPDQGTDHGFEVYDTPEKALTFVNEHPRYVYTIVKGEEVRLVQETVVTRWKFDR